MEEEEDVVLLELNHYCPVSWFLKHAEDCFCRTLQFHHWSSVPRGARGTVTVSGIGARRWGGEDGGEDEER